MGQKTYWHNLTKGFFNENDLSDAVENSSKDDIIKFSVRGNALIFDLRIFLWEIEDEGDNNHRREEFLKYFEEFHCEKFNTDFRK